MKTKSARGEGSDVSSRGKLRQLLGAVFLLGAPLVAYLPAMSGLFVYDDAPWIHAFGQVSFWSLWTDPGAMYQYYPLSHGTLWLDRWMWGDWTLPYHMENVLLHGCAAVLFWRLLARLEVRGAWLAGAIFALHPVMVESVAWITERKNVLTQVLFLAAFLQYGRAVEFWSDGTGSVRQRSGWILALVLFFASLLSKTTAVVLPPALLLVGWWKQGRFPRKEEIKPVLPFFALAVLLGLFTIWMEINQSGADGPDWDLTWSEHVLVAGRALWFYVGKLAWPVDLCFVYPRWEIDSSAAGQWLYPAGVVVVAILLWWKRKQCGRGVICAVLFFFGCVLPALGFLNMYAMLYSWVSDRWVYMPSLGFIALVAAGISHLADRFRKPTASVLAATSILSCCAVLTWRQAGVYKDAVTLWTRTIEQSPQASVAYVNLGNALYQERGLVPEAEAQYRMAVKLRPHDATAQSNLGRMRELQGDLTEAESRYQEALRLNPKDGRTRRLYGAMLVRQERHGEALIQQYADTIRNASQFGWRDLVQLAWTLSTNPDSRMRSGRHALEFAQKADELSRHRSAEVLQVLAAAYAEVGRYEQAVRAADEAIGLAGDTKRAVEIRAQQELYKQGKPYRVGSSTPATQQPENR